MATGEVRVCAWARGGLPLHASQPGASSLVAFAHADGGLLPPQKPLILKPHFQGLSRWPRSRRLSFSNVCLPLPRPLPTTHTPTGKGFRGGHPCTDTRPLPTPSEDMLPRL